MKGLMRELRNYLAVVLIEKALDVSAPGTDCRALLAYSVREFFGCMLALERGGHSMRMARVASEKPTVCPVCCGRLIQLGMARVGETCPGCRF